MTPEQAIDAAKRGKLLPVYLIVGEERHRQNTLVKALKEASLTGGIAGLNDDHFIAGEASIGQVLNVSRTLPMLGRRRFVLLRGAERWEAKSQKSGDAKPAKGDKAKVDELEELGKYIESPVETTTLVILASKLDTRRRLVLKAKKAGCFIECEPLARPALSVWIETTARARGNTISRSLADLIAEIHESDLSRIDDALERLSLFVGAGKEITEEALSTCLEIVKPSTVWQLVDAIARRDLGASLAALGRIDPNEPLLRLLGTLTWSTRQMIRFAAARADGLPPDEAAKRAGAPPFKAKDLNERLRGVSPELLNDWLETLATVDLALKGGSKRPAQAVMEEAILSFCAKGTKLQAANRGPRGVNPA